MQPLRHSVAAPPATLPAGVANLVRDDVICVTADGTVRWAGAAVEEALGRAPGELTGRHVSTLVPDYRHDQQGACMQRILAGEAVAPYLATCVRPDGSLVELAVTAGPHLDADGGIDGALCILRDVTDERRAHRDLERAVEQHRARFEQVSMPQAVVDLYGRLLTVNQAYCDLVGYSRSELVGTNALDLVHPMDSDLAETSLSRLREGIEESGSHEVVARHADGRSLQVLLDLTVLRDLDGQAYAVAMFAQDLTEVREAQHRLAAQQELFRALSRRASDAAVVTDAELNIRYVSPSVNAMFGYEPEMVVSLPGWDFIHRDDLDGTREIVEAVRDEPDSTVRFTLRLKNAAGMFRWVELTLSNCLTDPAIEGLVANLHDVTEQMEAEQALRDSEARYRAIVRTAHEGILAMTPAGDTLFANDRVAEIFGVPLDTIYDHGILSAIPADLAADLAHRLRVRRERGPESYEISYAHPDGTERVLSIAASPLHVDGDAEGGSLAMVSDVTDARRTEDRLRWQALHDPLTQLPNRAMLVDRLDAVSRRSASEGAGIAVLFMDLDQFKLVNDSRGHEAGDRMLVEVAARLRTAVRGSDMVARLGGDEFAVICADTDQEAALEVASRVQEALSAPIDLDGEKVYAGASVGVAVSPPHDPRSLLRFADAAMYKAKVTGGGVVVYDSSVATGAERKLAVSNVVRDALAQEQVALSYQSIVDLHTGRVVGLEALLHWEDHPELGAVPSRELVGVAGETGLSFALDRAVIATACREFVGLRESGAVDGTAYVSVNVSARTVVAALRDVVHDVLEDTGLPASCLMLEVTENSLSGDSGTAVETLRLLREAGVRVAIDDFGTGYSSLARLQRLPLDVLKVDRSFLENVVDQADRRAIPRAIVALADAMGLGTIAVGVESEEQAAVMREVGCGAAQGFLWDAALPAAAL